MGMRNIHGQRVQIAHFPGGAQVLYQEVMQAHVHKKYHQEFVPDEHKYTICTLATKNIVEKSPLIEQLKFNNIPFINEFGDQDVEWKRNTKPTLLYPILMKIETPYTLLLDAKDVVFTDNFGDFTDLLDEYKTDIVFNAGVAEFPKLEVETPKDRESWGMFKFLNAGVCFGKTEKIQKMYKYIIDEINDPKNNIDSEQYYVRKYWKTHPDEIMIDYKCMKFQVIPTVRVKDKISNEVKFVSSVELIKNNN